MKPLLAVTGALYCLLISVMVWGALIKAHRTLSNHSILGAVGATMFYTSDLLLTVNKWGRNIPHAQLLIMITYYSAQLFIAGSILGVN